MLLSEQYWDVMLNVKKTNETVAKLFPVILDVDNPEFYQRLDICVENMTKLESIDNSKIKLLQFLQKLPLYLSNGWQFWRLYFMKPIDTRLSRSQSWFQ